MASILVNPRQKRNPMAPVHLEPRHKRDSMASGNNRGQKLKGGSFWPRPNMSQFQTRGKMRKITGAKSPYCIGGVSPMDTNLKKFNLNLFYEKWILDFELDSNIQIWI